MRARSIKAQTLGAISREFTQESGTGGDPELLARIGAEIQAKGGITFARFMELSLYHPELGYYASGRARIGRHGDFFTNVSVGPVFGRLLAAQFAEIWDKLERPREFVLVEQGAHDGLLAADVLVALESSRPDCFAETAVHIVEPFPVLCAQQQKKLAQFQNRVRWFDSIARLPSFVGVHFSNELFDALPVHLLSSSGDGNWNELFVIEREEALALEPRALPGEMKAPELTSGQLSFRTEVCLAGPKLMDEIMRKLSRGAILSLDYGFTRAEYYSPDRKEGTLQVRAAHRKLSSPFTEVGLADISAHVEWSSVIEAAERAGAKLVGLTDQHHFLTGILSRLARPEDFSAADQRGLQTLLHPEMLGRNFQALALAKNFPASLSGFRFARALA